ncbi:uncharacterized protein LOC143283217 [Babylonia areolata]|uniref:uncharacterized protein LOC143283217 n=1 Tax=Babylonia areolata TaxID=304850 RepID=UPI003FD1AB07
MAGGSCCQRAVMVWGWLVLASFHLAWTVCQKPSTPAYAYSLSEDMTSYPVDYTYEIVCIPGYTMVGSGEMLCLGGGQGWNTTVPSCSPTVLAAMEASYPSRISPAPTVRPETLLAERIRI